MKQTKMTEGFTLIELVVAIAIVGILSTLSLHLYSTYVRKGRRVDAINALLSISLAEERYRSNNSQYGTLTQVWGGATSSPGGYYSISVSNVTAISYTITAQAQGDQANDAVSGTSCSSLMLSQSSGTITKSPSVCWPT